eukprot:767438-Hanusia_phi.AAC.6
MKQPTRPPAQLWQAASCRSFILPLPRSSSSSLHPPQPQTSCSSSLPVGDFENVIAGCGGYFFCVSRGSSQVTTLSRRRLAFPLLLHLLFSTLCISSPPLTVFCFPIPFR